MDFDKIYSVNNAFKRGALHVQPVQEFNLNKVFKSLSSVNDPLEFKYHSGSKPMDLVGTTHAWIKLFSEKVINILEKEGFKGWSTIPAKIFGKEGKDVDGYHVIQVRGHCGRIDDSKSREETIPPKSSKGKPRTALMGLYFDPESWDGSDIFSPEETGFIFVTKKVKQALEEAKVINIDFTPITEIENVSV